MTIPVCQPPRATVRKPRLVAPPGATDCHAHILGPPDRYPYLAQHAVTLTTGTGDERFLFAIDTFIAGVLAG